MAAKQIQKNVCGFCGSAPFTKDQARSHEQCPGAPCVCADAGHQPTGEVLTAQGRFLHLAPADVKARWTVTAGGAA